MADFNVNVNDDIRLNDTGLMAQQPAVEKKEEQAGDVYAPADVVRERFNTFRENKTLTFDSAITSALSPDETLAWVVRNRKWNEDWWTTKALWTGVTQLVNTIPKTAYALLDNANPDGTINERTGEIVQRTDAEIQQRRQAQENILKGLAGFIDTIDEAGYQNLDVRTTGAKFWAGVLQNAPNFAAQVAVGNYAGAGAAAALMTAQIAGEQYYDLRQQGVDRDRAAGAALVNASVQYFLEKLGMKGWLNASRAGSVKNVLKTTLKSVIEEGGTEALQEVPEQVTNIWAEHPEMSFEGIADLWWQNKGQYVENMLMAGAIGALFGGVAGGFNSIGMESWKSKLQKANIDRLGAAIQQDIKDGINPMYVGVTSDTNAAMQNTDNKAFVDAKALSGFFKTVSETDANNLALMMVTTVENVDLAARQGGEIETTIGGVEAASVATKGALFEAIKNDLTFDLNEKSINENAQYQKMMQSAYALDVQETTELNAEIDKMFEKSALPKEQMSAVKAMMARMATTASQGENPAEWLRKHPAEVQRVYETRTIPAENGYNMTAREKLDYDVKKWGETVDKSINIRSQKRVKFMDTPLVMQLCGVEPGEIQTSYDTISQHILQTHKDSVDIDTLKQLPKAFADPLFIGKSRDSLMLALELKGINGADIVSFVKVTENNGKYYADFLSSVYAKDGMYGKSNGNAKTNIDWFIDNFLNKPQYLKYINIQKTTNWLAVNGRNMPKNAKSTSGISVNNIPNESDLVKLKNENPGFYQSAWHGSQVKKKLDALKEKDFNEFNDVIKRSNGDLLKYHSEKWENDSASSKRVKAALKEIEAHPVLSKLATPETLQHYFNGEYIATSETLLFTLYADASVDGRNQFDLVEWANNKGIGDVKTAEAMLNGLSFNHPEWINYSGTLDLHNISLRENMMQGNNNMYKAVLATGYSTESGKPLDEANSDEYIFRPNGSKTFGYISDEVSEIVKNNGGNLPAGEIRLKVGFRDGEKGEGLIHAKKHELNARNIGYSSVEELITDVASGFDKIYRIKATNEDGTKKAHDTYVLVKNRPSPKNPDRIVPIYFDLKNDTKGNYYLVLTAYPRKYNKKEGLVYDRGVGQAATATSDGSVPSADNKAGVKSDSGSPTVKHNPSFVDDSIPQNDGNINIDNKEFFSLTDGQILGSTSWDADGKAIINLFNGSDVSTVTHEIMHYFLEAVNTDVLTGFASENQVKDLETLLKYAGTTTADFQKMTEEQKRTYHERIAEAFETYLMERKAPSFEIKKIFDKIKNWMLSIYEHRKRNENALPLTDEVAAVFDSMLASEEALREVEVADGYLASLPKAVVDTLDEKSKDKLRGLLLQVHDKAVDILAKRANENFSEERKAQIAKFKADILPVVTQQIQDMPLYQAEELLRQYTNIALTGKGDKANVRAIARRYLNQDGKAFANWEEELNAVNAELDDLILPVVEDLESGMGNGVTIVEVPEEVQGGSNYYRYSNNEEWYQNWYSEYGRRPNKEELKELAIKNLTGNAGRFTARSMYGIPEDIATENESKIKELQKRQEVLQEQQDKVKLGRKKGLSEEDMNQFNYIAEYNGFANGQELAYQILNMPTELQAINNRVDEYAKMQFPDFWREKATALEAAREALYNDPHAELIALEEQLMYDALNDTLQKQQSHQAKVQMARSEAEAAKAEAFSRIRDMSVRKARLPRQFIADERRAAVNAAEAMAKGDIEAALKYKHQQLVAHQMVGMSMEFREAHAAALRYVKNVSKKPYLDKSKKKVGYWHTGEFFLAAADLMTRMGLNVTDYDPDKHLGENNLKNVLAKYREQGWEFVINDELLADNMDIMSPDNLTVEQFKNIVDSLRNFRAVANAINGANEELKAKNWEEVKAKVLEELSKLETVWVPQAGEKSEKGAVEWFNSAHRSTPNLFEVLDNWHYGYFSKTWYNMLKHCGDKEFVMTDKWDSQSKEITEKWAKALKSNGINVDDKVSYGDLGVDENGKDVQLTRHHLIAMLCYMGSQESIDRLCSTPIVGVAKSDVWVTPADNSRVAKAEAIEATRKNIKDFLGRHVTKEDIEYAQSILNICDQWWPELKAVNERTRGFSPDKVMAVPQTYTLANGETVTMNGGYCPMVRNGETGSRPAGMDILNADAVTDLRSRNQGRFISTASSASNSRTNADYPLDISQGWFDISIRDTIHDICYREAIQEFSKLFNDAEIFNVMKRKLGIGGMEQFKEMLLRTAKPYDGVGMGMAANGYLRMFNWLKQRVVQTAIMGKFTTITQNLSNAFLYGNAIEGWTQKDTAMAMYKWSCKTFTSGGLRELNDICSRSKYFAERSKFVDFSIRDIAEKTKLSKIDSKINELGGEALALTDFMTAKPVWAEAFTKKLNEGATEQEAIDFADMLMVRTLGSSRRYDLSSMQGSRGYFSLFTIFQSFFNTQYNQWAREYNIDKRLLGQGQYEEFVKRASSFLAAKYVGVCVTSLLMALKNPFGNDGDDEDKPWNITQEMMSYPFSMGGPSGQFLNACLQRSAGLKSYGYRMSSVQSGFERILRTGDVAKKLISGNYESMQELIEPTVGAATFYYGIPDQMNTLFWNVYDIVMNDMDPEWGDLMRRRPKKDR